MTVSTLAMIDGDALCRSLMYCILADQMYQRYRVSLQASPPESCAHQPECSHSARDHSPCKARPRGLTNEERLQAELKEKLGKMYDVRDSSSVFVFGFRTQVCYPGSPEWSTCMLFALAAVPCLFEIVNKTITGSANLLMPQCSLVAASLLDLA